MLFPSRPPTTAPEAGRRGVILLVVIALLALFAAVALSFVYYAEQEATAARYDRQAGTLDKADVEPELLLSYALGQLLCDTDNLQSALRGHSLARSMYGLNPGDFNTNPFNGIGRLRYTDPLLGADNYYLVNTQYHSTDNFIRDPEFYGKRGDATYRYLGGANVPWTYPDADNMFLAALNADGELLLPSFHRSWIASAAAPANMQKYRQLYPHKSHHPQFADSEEGAGAPHVRNLDSGRGLRKSGGGYYHNDSYWMDLGFPVLTAPDGKRFKPLFAPLVVDLDGKLNANAAGNIRGLDTSGKTTLSASNHGRGPWEINLSKVLTRSDWVNLFRGKATVGVRGRYGPDGQPAAAGSQIPLSPPTSDGWLRSYSGFDADGVQDDSAAANAYRISTKFILPGEGAPNDFKTVFSPFPYYPSASYGNGAGGASGAFERTNHPLLFNPIGPPADDRVFPASSMEALLRYGGTGSPALQSPLFRLSPLNFGDPSDLAGSARRRRLVTTHSFDPAAPGARAWLSATATPTFQLGAGAYPTGGTVATPAFSANPGGEFAADWRAVTASLGRLNINRDLPAHFGYVTDATNANPIVITSATAHGLNTGDRVTISGVGGNTKADGTFTITKVDDKRFSLNGVKGNNAPTSPGIWVSHAAQKARQDLAKDIFDRLRWVTTGQGPDVAFPAKTTNEYAAMRWLAQLAVNIVDYRDTDDYITPFNWDTNDPTSGWVYGVEVPRIVINEIYSEVVNDPQDPLTKNLATKDYNVNFWCELHNPQTKKLGDLDPIVQTDPTNRNAARLQVPDPQNAGKIVWPVYKLTIATPPAAGGAAFSDTNLGTPTAANTKLEVAAYEKESGTKTTVDTDLVLAADGAYLGADQSNQGFYVLGPAADFPTDSTIKQAAGTDHPAPFNATLRVKSQTINGVTSAMMYTSPKASAAPTSHNLFLQRLACPYLKPNPDPATGILDATLPYNPYLTVDYVQNVPVYDARKSTTAGVNGAFVTYPNRKAKGRKQPFAAHSSQQVDQNPSLKFTNQPQHTMFRHNAREATAPPSAATAGQTLQVPFDWLVHLDRVLNNPLELLHVSALAPCQLTQQFMTGAAANQRFAQRAPWFDPSARIYRFLELVETGQRASGVASRIPGKININTIWDAEVFQALVDHQAGLSSYDPATVATIFTALKNSRTPSGLPDANDRPFKSLGVSYVGAGDAQFPNGSGIDDTILRTDPSNAARRLLEVTPTAPAGSDQPYLKYELLQKVFNNATTRSNVFAVWLTVGFFEVVDESVQPPRLGKELGRDAGRHIRHRLFAIVDRSELVVPSLLGSTFSAGAITAQKTAQTIPVQLSGVTATAAASIKGSSSLAAPREVTCRWTLQAGTKLTIDTGANQETVTLLAVNGAASPPTITAVFTKAHSNGAGQGIVPVSVPGTPGPTVGGLPTVYGNPGPQTGFDHRRNRAVVLHFSVIE